VGGGLSRDLGRDLLVAGGDAERDLVGASYAAFNIVSVIASALFGDLVDERRSSACPMVASRVTALCLPAGAVALLRSAQISRIRVSAENPSSPKTDI